MFGYVRPLRGELKVREDALYRSCYCGLCRIMGREYGLAARMTLSYDMTFLAMLLWDKDTPAVCAKHRCPVHPLRRQQMCPGSESLRSAAASSVILTWWKLRDSAADDGFFGRLGAKLGCLCLQRGYRKAKKALTGFDEAVSQKLAALSAMEKQNETSLDRTADCFASMLAHCAFGKAGAEKREAELLLYHIGRWIYIVDAVDDLKKDAESGAYNPVDRRFALGGGCLSDEQKRYLEQTLLQSVNLAGSALELMAETPWTNIIRNIVYLGTEAVSRAVLEGKFRAGRRERKDL